MADDKDIEGGFLTEPQLYDLGSDIGEQVNLAAQYPDRVVELEAVAGPARAPVGPGVDPVAQDALDRGVAAGLAAELMLVPSDITAPDLIVGPGRVPESR